MTFFLPDTKELPVVYPDTPDIPQSSMWEGFGASISKTMTKTNASFYRQRMKSAIRDELAREAAERVGLDGLIEFANREGVGMDPIWGTPGSVEDIFFYEYGMDATDWALSAAREQAGQEPEAWADLDLSDDAIEAEMARRMKVDYEAALNTLSGMPSGHGVIELVGGMVGIALDVKNIPFLLMGGGGSILRVAGREALINMTAELAFMPDQFIQADLLEIPDPNVLQQLAMAAGFGAAFGGTMAALGRGFELMRISDAAHERVMADMDLSQVQRVEVEARLNKIFENSTRDPVMEAQREVGRVRGQRAEVTGRSFTDDFQSPAARTDAATYFDTTPRAPEFDPESPAVTSRRAPDPVSPESLTPSQRAAAITRADVAARIGADVGATVEEITQTIETAITRRTSDLEAAQGRGPKAAIRKDIRNLNADLETVRKLPPDTPVINRATGQPDSPALDGQEPALTGGRTGPGQADGPRRGAEPGDAAPEPAQAVSGRAEPITPRQRFEASQATPVRGRGTPESKVDTATRDQRAFFSDLASPEARTVHDSVAADLRAKIEQNGDFEIDLGDGKGIRNASEVLEELEDMQDFADVMQLCGRKVA